MLERAVKILDAIDPYFIVKGIDIWKHLFLHPLLQQGLRRIEHIAQTEHRANTARFQVMQGVTHFAVQTQRFLVNDEQVGRIDLGGLANDRLANRQGFAQVDVQAQRGVLAIVQLDDARYANEIHPRLEFKTADHR